MLQEFAVFFFMATTCVVVFLYYEGELDDEE